MFVTKISFPTGFVSSSHLAYKVKFCAGAIIVLYVLLGILVFILLITIFPIFPLKYAPPDAVFEPAASHPTNIEFAEW